MVVLIMMVFFAFQVYVLQQCPEMLLSPENIFRIFRLYIILIDIKFVRSAEFEPETIYRKPTYQHYTTTASQSSHLSLN